MHLSFLRPTNWSLAFKLGMFILIGATAVFAGVFTYNYYESRRVLMRNIEESAGNLTLATVNRIETVLHGVQAGPNYLAQRLERGLPEQVSEVEAMLADYVRATPSAYGACAAFEPNTIEPAQRYSAPYAWRTNGNIGIGRVEYAYDLWDWYIIPREIERPLWSEPYYDDAGQIIMSTYASPFFRTVDGKREVGGVVTADLSLEFLNDVVGAVKLVGTGYAFVISQNGQYVVHPKHEFVMRESIFSVAEAMNSPELRLIGRDMLRGGKGFVKIISPMDNEPAWMYYAPLPAAQWSLGVVITEKDLFAEVRALDQKIILAGSAGLLLLVIVVMALAATATSPLRTLTRTTAEMAKGNLDVALPPLRSHDEVGELTHAFDGMRLSLKAYIRNLTETTAAKERIESELSIARQIQMGLLPRILPTYPNRQEFDICAVIQPAKEVGGDFYDFFFTDDNRFCFAIGDVSGKGVPASLFMAITKTLLAVSASPEVKPATMFNQVNFQLAHDNPNCMFVTLFCGVLDLETGLLLYTNGGHNPPLCLRASGETLEMPPKGDPVLGIFEHTEYHNTELQMNPGDVLYLYTDGVSEAMNTQSQLYSDARLLAQVEMRRELPIKSIMAGIQDDITVFVEGAPQSDDITMLLIKFKGITKDVNGNAAPLAEA